MGVSQEIDPRNPKFTFDDVYSLSLHKFVGDVSEITDRASKEAKLEMQNEDLEYRWSKESLLFARPPEWRFRWSDECVDMLEADQLTVGSMMASRYLDNHSGLYDGVKLWQRRLTIVSKVKALW